MQHQVVGRFDRGADFLDIAGEAESGVVVGIELAEWGVGGIGAVEPGEVDVIAGQDFGERGGGGLRIGPLRSIASFIWGSQLVQGRTPRRVLPMLSQTTILTGGVVIGGL